MIELVHLATGALAGRRCRTHLGALAAGIVMHGLMDIAPHREIGDKRWEQVSTAVGLGALAARHGIASPVTIGALGGVLPDLEHSLPERMTPDPALYPTHRWKSLHAPFDNFAPPAWLQVVAGGAVLGSLVANRRAARAGS